MRERLALAEMPQIDHRVCQSFQGIVQLTDPLEAQQQATELMLPGEHSLDGEKTFLKDCRVENRFASPLWSLSATRICRNIRHHAAIENGFAVRPTIVDPIETDGGLVQVESDRLGNYGTLVAALPATAVIRSDCQEPK